MKYYYFNPFSKQYYFPVDFHNYPIFATFYQPYRFTAKLMWKVWQKSRVLRNLFSTEEPEKVLPLMNIREYVALDSILTFNLGTVGVEQKISILGVDKTTNSEFYIKYATSEIACKNVYNEGLVLQQLSKLPFVPKLEMCVQEQNSFTLIKTSALKGRKLVNRPMNENLFTMLITLSAQEVKSTRKYSSELRSCFAHGDFCPWNMLSDDGFIKLFDWEMAGQYTLGYDLFTYIFQYEFLVNKKNRFDQLLDENAKVISRYFNYFEVDEWRLYLKEFSDLKYNLETEKNNSDLIKPYLELKKYIEKMDLNYSNE
ncbi:MAG: phosphotransferase [Paludibacter sp.]|nr:phosphotransferase [Paludibacter sp.]